MGKTLVKEDIDLLEEWWVKKSRKNFLAYRNYLRHKDFLQGWFIQDVCKHLQQFYVDYTNGLKPILFLSTPPQHGKSWSVMDFITWILGKDPRLRLIYATYSDILGVRANLSTQRTLSSDKHNKIFPETLLAKSTRGGAKRTTKQLEIINSDDIVTSGYFRNTTVKGSVTGETLDIGLIDDAVKGREQANSITWSQKIWEWFTDDFGTRFSENAGLLIIMTRWTTHDIIARLEEKFKATKRSYKYINYKALASEDETRRKEGEALFPELKSVDFLLDKKGMLDEASWTSLYEGNPTIQGGNVIKDDWWEWYTILPPLAYKFLVADTAQKDKKKNDWTILHCYGFGIDKNLYLIDRFRAKLQSPALRVEAELFYNTHNSPREKADDPILRGLWIEDKSSGSGLIQELKKKGLRINEVQRNVDKYFRAQDVAPFIKSGLVHLSTKIKGVENLTKEAREFPNSSFDDEFDTLMTAVEITYINKKTHSSLQAAMEAA